MGTHALLSASAAHRWLNCAPSARLTEGYPDDTSVYAAEGTDAHELCEHKLKRALGMKTRNPARRLKSYSPEMEDCANGYAAYILELIQAAKTKSIDPQVLIEQKLDFSRWVPEGFGTGDCVIIADGTLHVVDYKHGAGVVVEAENNPQLMLYALGALELFDAIYDIEQVAMTIYQPRRENISTFTMTKADLLAWATGTLAPAATTAFAGEGEYHAGEWCQFCKAKQNCRGRAEAHLALAQHEFKNPALLADDEVQTILTQVDDLVAWAEDVKSYALQQALAGKQWPGFKVVEGRSNRRYTNEPAVAAAVSNAGYDPYEHKVMGITAMEKHLGKPKFNELLADLVEKPAGKPALVPLSDKRPPINTAATDFAATND